MIDRPEYARSLFVFNDNKEQFYDFFTRGDAGGAGAGNASIRPYQGLRPPKATGVPTGTMRPYEGYSALSGQARKAIDDSMTTLADLLSTGNYDQVVMSWDPVKQTLGTGLFKPADSVLRYIVDGIEKTVDEANAN